MELPRVSVLFPRMPRRVFEPHSEKEREARQAYERRRDLVDALFMASTDVFHGGEPYRFTAAGPVPLFIFYSVGGDGQPMIAPPGNPRGEPIPAPLEAVPADILIAHYALPGDLVRSFTELSGFSMVFVAGKGHHRRGQCISFSTALEKTGADLAFSEPEWYYGAREQAFRDGEAYTHFFSGLMGREDRHRYYIYHDGKDIPAVPHEGDTGLRARLEERLTAP